MQNEFQFYHSLKMNPQHSYKIIINKIQIQYLYKFTHKLSYLLKSVPWVSIHIFFGPAKNSAYPEMYAFVSFLNI